MAFIFAAAWISAALLSWFLYRTVRAPQRESSISVVALNRNMSAGMLVKESDLKTVSLREREVPSGAVRRQNEAVNRALLSDAFANEALLDQKLSSRTGIEGIAATIEEGKRAVAVRVDSFSGAGELIGPQDHVDVLFTKPGKMSEAVTLTILQDVKVLSAGLRVRAGEKADPKAPKIPVVTLLVTPEDAQKLELAKNQGRISLVLRNPGETRNLASASPATGDLLDPMGIDRPSPIRARAVAPPPPPDPKPLPSPVVKENPDTVVDVFRGGKHTQEVFH